MEQNFDWRYKRQKEYSLDQSRLNEAIVNGEEIMAYDNMNFSVFPTNKCNARCEFCIAELRYFEQGKGYVKEKRRPTHEEYYERLDEVLSEIVPTINPSVSITGGEPSLDKKLPTLLKILDSHGVRKRTMTTNGAGLLRKSTAYEGDIMDHLADYKLEHLNISRAHYDDFENARLMKFQNRYFTNDMLAEVIERAHESGMKTRLSCALLQEGVHELDQIKKYLDFAQEINADTVIFRQLTKFDQKTVVPGIIPTYCLDNNVELNPIWEEIDKDSNFKFEHQVLGYYYYVEVYNYKDITSVYESANLLEGEAERDRVFRIDSGKPLVHEMILHPNGNLCASWVEDQDVIWEFDK